MELPFVVLFVFVGMLWCPDVLLEPYEWFVWFSYPFLIVLEGLAFLFLALSLGQYLISRISLSEEDSEAIEDDENMSWLSYMCCGCCRALSLNLLLKVSHQFA